MQLRVRGVPVPMVRLRKRGPGWSSKFSRGWNTNTLGPFPATCLTAFVDNPLLLSTSRLQAIDLGIFNVRNGNGCVRKDCDIYAELDCSPKSASYFPSHQERLNYLQKRPSLRHSSSSLPFQVPPPKPKRPRTRHHPFPRARGTHPRSPLWL